MPNNSNPMGRNIFYAVFFCWFILGLLLHNTAIIIIPLIVLMVVSAALGWKKLSFYQHPVSRNFYNEGVKYLQSNEWDKAIECFDQAISNYPQFAPAYQNRAAAWLRKDKLDHAIRDYNHAIQLDPNNAQLYFNRAVTYFQKGYFDKALADCDQISKQSGDSSVDVFRGSIFLAQGRNEEAIVVLERAVEGSKRSSSAHFELANAYERVRNNDLALEHYNIALEIEPRNAILYNNRGLVYLRTSQFTEAIADCNKAIMLDSKLLPPFGTRGQAYFLMGKYQEALNDFNRAVKLNSGYKLAVVGQSLCQNAIGNTKEAFQLWRTLIAIDPQYNTIDKLIEDYHPAQGFVDTVRKLINNFNNEPSKNTEKDS